jgi:hypothetical protein
MSRKILSHSFIAVVSFVIGVLLSAYILPNTYFLSIDQTATTSQSSYNAEIYRIIGGTIYHEQKHNTYTDIGKTFERNLKFWANVTQNATHGKIGWVSLSNDASPLASWTQLAGEATTMGASRKPWDTPSNVNSTSVNGTVTFTFAGTITLQTAGIQWKSTQSNSNLYAVFSFTQTTFNLNDQLIIKYYNRESGS